MRHSTWKYGVNDLVKDLGGRTLWQRARVPLGIAACVAVVAGVLLVSGGDGDPPVNGGASVDCKNGVTAANLNTSCEFATAVAKAYRSEGEPEMLTEVKSPVTGYEYDLECTPESPAVCTTTDSTDPKYSAAASIRIN